MAKNRSAELGGVTFGGQWKLWPMDDRNWELCRRRDDGAWRRLGKYYQYNTLDNALAYAADRELKERRADEAATISDALDELRGLLDGFVSDIRAAMGGEAA